MYTGYKKAIELLVEKGANVNDAQNKWKMTPLHYIALYDHKDWTDVDNLSNSRQCFCVFKKDFKVLIRKITFISKLEYAEVLINHGANVHAKDSSNQTPFDLARSQEGAQFMKIMTLFLITKMIGLFL